MRWAVKIFSIVLAIILISSEARVEVVREQFNREIADCKYNILFKRFDVAVAGGVDPIALYLSVGDITTFITNADYKSDAVIIPSNIDFDLNARNPPSQKIFVERMTAADRSKISEAVSEFKRRKGSRAEIATEWVAVDLRPGGVGTPSRLPRFLCLLATDRPEGGTGTLDHLRPQQKIRIGVAGCMNAFAGFGARSVAMPMVGAATIGQGGPLVGPAHLRVRCRIMNAVLGIAWGIREAAEKGSRVPEVGVVFWSLEAQRLFGPNPSSSMASIGDFARQIERDVTTVLQGGTVRLDPCPGATN